MPIEIGLFGLWALCAARRPTPTRWSAQADHWPQALQADFQSALQAADFLRQPKV